MNYWIKNLRVSTSFSLLIKEHNLKLDILKTKSEKNLFSFICFGNYILKSLVESSSNYQYNHTGELSVYKYKKLREVWTLTNINYISYDLEFYGLVTCSIASDSVETISSKYINIY